ncbi:MAG: Nif3-like dinuclear metal center hexameric protein [Paenisporosarcina sp.]
MVNKLNTTLKINSFGADSSFKRFLPDAYESINYDWKSNFEHPFTELFNGLMIKGSPYINKVFLAVFPTDDILKRFISEGEDGDLLFMHHPLLMECGDPKGQWGRGFVPIKEEYIRQIKEKNLSVYTCHLPLDYHPELGTSVAISKSLNTEIIDGFIPLNHFGDLILICSIQKTSTDDFITTLKELFHIPYVDFEGKKHRNIEKIAIVAGCGDKVEWMKEAASKGVQAYITGEIHCHINSDYGKQKYKTIKEYALTTPMSLIGVSHSASEYLVKKTLIKDWFEHNFDVQTVMIPQENWWL